MINRGMKNSNETSIHPALAILATPGKSAEVSKPIPLRPFPKTPLGEHASVTAIGSLVIRASKVLLPDGKRSGLMEPMDPTSGRWRRMGDNGRWIYGHLDLKGDAVFVDSDYQIPKTTHNRDSLPGHLAASATVREMCQDDDFAVCLYEALADHHWTNEASGKTFKTGWANAARWVAELRDLNESYLDFFDSGIPGFVSQDVMDVLNSLGWVHEMVRDNSKDLEMAEKMVIKCEGNPVGKTPLWYSCWMHGLNDEDTLGARMHRCAYRGQANIREWEQFYMLNDWEV